MSTQSTVWIVISCEEVADKLRQKLDGGFFSEAMHISEQIKSFLEKISKEVETRGGSLYVNLPDRQVLEMPITVAEELPNIIEGYTANMGHVSVGVGLTFSEASMANQKSRYSHEIELYEPGETYKSAQDDNSMLDNELMLPPNLFDPKTPPPAQVPSKFEFISRPDAGSELQAEAQLISGIVQQMAPPPPQMPPGAQQQQGDDQGPQDLLESLHGGKVPGHTPEDKDDDDKGSKKDSSKKKTDDKSSKKDSSNDDSDDDDSEDDDDDSDKGDLNNKLGKLLADVKNDIPHIMSMADSNPQAFKQTMALIQKLVTVARGRKKTEKTEDISELQELQKAIGSALRRLPVGTVKGRRKKVMVDGRAVWRSVANGLVQDNKGQAISVRSSNYLADHPKPDAGKKNA
ncbi:MAG: hypothetical protein ACREGB_00570 [Candidatus Saccharimonadales bacterium]